MNGARRPHRLWARLRSDERGIALVMALGFMVALGATGASVAYYATSNQTAAAHSYEEKRAEALAEAGLNIALATLYNAADPRNAAAVPLGSRQMEGGLVEWWGTLTGTTWTLVGRGTVRNPMGPYPIVRRRSTQVAINTGQQASANNAIWNYLYADDPDACTTLSNSVTINIPLYTRGSLCLNNSAQMIGSYLQVGGTVTINNTATIGSAGTPITEARVAGGCRVGGGAFNNPCSSADRVYANTINSTPTALVKPPVDLAGWYENADLGPNRNCTSGSFPGGFDDDLLLNRSRDTVDLTPATAYDCRVLDAQGNLVAQLTWTPGSPGSLIVKGTIFFDGDIVFSGNVSAVYEGRSTIYSSGRISFSNYSSLCGTANCDAAWNANENLIAFVAGSSTDSAGFSMSNNTAFQGAVYAVTDYAESNSAMMWGPVIARQLYISNNTQNHYVPIGTLLPGMPATYEEVMVLAPVTGSFGE